MKRIILSSLFILAGLVVFSQSIPNPVTWTYSTKKVKRGYEVHMTARIGNGYRIYGKDPGGNLKPIVFLFNSNPAVVVDPAVREVGTVIIKKYGAWETKTRSYEKTVDFVVKVKLKEATKTRFTGKIKFLVGNDDTAAQWEVDFSVPVGYE